MSSTNVLAGYDYIVSDLNGVRKVINGVEHPLTEVELAEFRREHKDTGCTECSFVVDSDTLSIFHVSKEQKAEVRSDPILIGNYTMPNWKGHSPFYLFKCFVCGGIVVDYPHGYQGKLNCNKCRSGDVARAPNL